jgi:arylsulfatase A
VKRTLFFLIALGSTYLQSSATSHGAESAKPNVVMIYIDDLGYADIGPFGATKQKTPHLDRMAQEGLKLTSFYAAPVCSVSRAQLLTGCYGARVSVPGVFGPASKNGLHPQEHTIADCSSRRATPRCASASGMWAISRNSYPRNRASIIT